MAFAVATVTHKTDAIMKLLTGSNLAVNPMLDNEFKQNIIGVHRSAEAYRKEKEQEAAAKRKQIQALRQTTEMNITAELISELLPEVLKRFSCCGCKRCFAEAMADARDAVPALIVKIHNEADCKRAEGLKLQHRKDVLGALVKLAISRRALPRHT